MDKIRDISIQEAVLHVLDNNSDKPILNNYRIVLNDEVYRFILSHIERIFKDNDLKYALFKENPTVLKETSQNYLNGQVDLLKASKYIANSLFSFMKSDNSIPSCNLLVVSISTEYGPMLGILKLDYIKQYTHDIDFINDNVVIKIAPITTGLPTTKKVQKAAFIKPINSNQEYNLLVLDKGKISDEYGASYFTENFLGCLLIDNDRDNTRTFMNSLESWTRANLGENAVKAEHIRSFARNELKENKEINVYEFASKILPFEESRKNFISYMQDRDIEKIIVDKEYLEKRINKLKLKIDSDIEISITEEAYKDINRFEIKNNGDGSITFMIKNVEKYAEK
ncbi:nucleoid-associated protein [Haloimpatiens massiliensis]|uniref:nucleoid-associated protein n=1 Tax=Haloimpatiens massiliensis TaxID=1658110 RepID=UPI000C85A654|nr:nucleoid-associated protein [Haloimpatiens massiliensis]